MSCFQTINLKGEKMDFKGIIREVKDFPKEGINFIDLTTLWKDKEGLKASIDKLAERYKGKKIDKIVGAESRGFIIGTPLAYILGAGFVPVRKPNKLPSETVEEEYSLEYGTDSICIHKDAIEKNENILIVDDLIATGGTINAVINLVNKLGGNIIECCFLVELTFLDGGKNLPTDYFSLIKY